MNFVPQSILSRWFVFILSCIKSLLLHSISSFIKSVSPYIYIIFSPSPHPYAFFNADHHSMTFLGFNIDAEGNMIDQISGQILDRNVMLKPLQEALKRNHVPLNENFDNLQR